MFNSIGKELVFSLGSLKKKICRTRTAVFAMWQSFLSQPPFQSSLSMDPLLQMKGNNGNNPSLRDLKVIITKVVLDAESPFAAQ